MLLRLAKRLAKQQNGCSTDNHRQRQSLGHLERYPVAFRSEPDECGQKRGQRRGQHRVGGDVQVEIHERMQPKCAKAKRAAQHECLAVAGFGREITRGAL